MNIKAIADMANAIWSGRDSVNAAMDELAKYIYPDAQCFSGPMGAGDDGRRHIWDSTPEDADNTLACALSGLLTNPAVNWFSLDLTGEETSGGDTGIWLTEVSRRMLAALSAPDSRFYEEVSPFYMDLAVLAWAVLLTEYKDGEGLRFKAVSPGQCALAEDASGRVDTVVRRFGMNALQIAEEFGEAALSRDMRSALEKDPFREFALTHLVMPRAKLPAEARPGRGTAATRGGDPDDATMDGAVKGGGRVLHPYVDIVFAEEGEQLLRQGGYFEFPYACPRWSKRAGEVYGRGCGHAALPDIRVLNRVSLSQLDAAEKASNPPLLVPDDSVIDRRINTYPGGITYWRPSGGEISPLPVAARLETMQLIREERKDSIRRLFLNDRLQLADGPQMTATEILARERRQMLVLGPVLGRLQTEFLGPLISRVFGLLYRAGRLPEAPDAIRGKELTVRYVSPVARAQKQGEAENFNHAFSYVSPLLTISPELLDNFDQDAIVRDTREIFGYPEKYLRDERKVKRLRAEKVAAAEALAASADADVAASLSGGGR
jgi:hypothetical protein